MTQKLYFLAPDKANNSYTDLWVTDGTTTVAVGGISNLGVSGTVAGGLGPQYLTVFGQLMIFAGADHLNTGSSNGLWVTDGTAAGTVEIGGVSPGQGHASNIAGASPVGLNPSDFVVFGGKAIFSGTDTSGFTGLWVTDGVASGAGTIELGGSGNVGIAGSQITNNVSTLSPENITAFNNSILFDGRDSSGFNGLWISDGTTANTLELGGLQNQAIFDSGTSAFVANNFITLGSMELFSASNKEGDNALWITDGTAAGTVEIGGLSNDGLAGATNTGLGAGLANAVRLGARVLFGGADNAGATGLWSTDGTAAGTFEIGGLANSGLIGQHPSSLGLTPTALAINGPQVLFNGVDAIGYNELWVSDGTVAGTYEIGGESGPLANEAVAGLNPGSIVSLGNGKSVFIGDDKSNNQNSGKPTLWVTDGTAAGTQEIGGLDNLGVTNIYQNGGFSFTNSLVGGAGIAYFMGFDAAGTSVLWETDGTLAGTKVVQATDGNGPNQNAGNPSPNPYLSPSSLAPGPVPAATDSFTTGGQSINLGHVPGETLNLAETAANELAYTVTGSNGTINLISTLVSGTTIGAAAALIGGGLLVKFVGSGNSATLSNTNGNKDTIYGAKGAVTLSAAQANAYGQQSISFAAGTQGNVINLYNTNGSATTVSGFNGTINLNSAQAIVTGGGDTVNFVSGSGNAVTLNYSSGNQFIVNGSAGSITLTGAGATLWAIGASDVINVAAGDTATTSGDNNAIYASNATLWFSAGDSGNTVYGNSDSIIVVSGDAIGVAGNNSTIYTSSSSVFINANSSGDVVSGNGDAIYVANGDTVGVTGLYSSIYANGLAVYVNAGSSGDVVIGNGDAIVASGASVGLTGNNGTIYASGQAVYINAGSSGDVVVGNGDAIIAGGLSVGVTGNNSTIYANGQAVYFNSASGGDAVLGNGDAIIVANGDTIGIVGNSSTVYANSATLFFNPNSTGDVVVGNGDTDIVAAGDSIGVNGANAIVDAGGSTIFIGNSISGGAINGGTNLVEVGASDSLTVTGNGNTLNVLGANGALTITGTGDHFQYIAGFGAQSITGFSGNGGDVISLANSEFASISALISGATMSGGNALIHGSNGDVLTLVGVNTNTLVAGEFGLHS